MAELALNCFFHEGLGTSPFHALYGREPPALIAAPPSAATPPDVARDIRERGDLIVTLRRNLEKAQNRMRAAANRHRRHVEFEVGDRVLLKLQQYRQHSVGRPISAKLGCRFYGPFEIIERIGQVAYRLKLPEGSRIHNVFHVSLLRPFVEGSQSTSPTFPVVFARGLPIARSTRLVARRTVLCDGAPHDEGQLEWSDDGGTVPTWEPITMIEKHFPDLLVDKELLNEGGVDTGTTSNTSMHASGEDPRTPAEPDFATRVDDVPEEAPTLSTRPRRQPKPVTRYGDFVPH